MELLSSPDDQNIPVLGNAEHGPTCTELGEPKKWNLPRITVQTCFKIRAEGLGVVFVGSGLWVVVFFLSTYWSGNSNVWVLILLCKLRILSSIKGHCRKEKSSEERNGL